MVNKKTPLDIKSDSQNKDDKEKKQPNFNVGRVLAGLFFVLVGTLALADSIGWLSVNWQNLWYFWPVIIIAVGLSILSIGGWIWKLTTMILGLIALAIMGWFMTIDAPILKVVSSETVIQKSDSLVDRLDVNIKTGASSINVSSSLDDSAAKILLKSNFLELSNKTETTNGVQEINLTTEVKNQNSWLFGDVKNSWDVYLNRDLPVNLSFDVGASNLDLNLRDIKLDNLDINSGVSNLEVWIGSLEKEIAVNIDAGVSSIVIKVPKTSGVSLITEGGLNSQSLSGLDKIDDSNYRSSNYNKSDNKINIVTKIGVSSFSLERY